MKTTHEPRAEQRSKRRVRPNQPQLPSGTYFAGATELKGMAVVEAGIARVKLVSAIMPAYVPAELEEDKDKFERAGDENRPLRLYLFPVDRAPPADYVQTAEAEEYFLTEVTVQKQQWTYEVQGGYKWTVTFDVAVPPLNPDDPDIQAVKIADWVIGQGIHHIILVDPRNA
jgi:hypothetical protein